MGKMKRMFALVLILVMALGFVPTRMLEPAFADTLTLTYGDGINFGGNLPWLTNKYPWGTKQAHDVLPGMNNLYLNSIDAWCLDMMRVSSPNSPYYATGDGIDSISGYWQSISATDKRLIAGVLLYWSDHKASTLTSNAGLAPERAAKMGAQYAIYSILSTDQSRQNLDNAVDDYYFGDVKEYAAAAIAWANSQPASSSVTVGVPSFDGNTIELIFDEASGRYEGSVTDTNGYLASEGYNFTQTVSGITVTQTGNTVFISATPAAAAAAGLDGDNNTWSANATATKSVQDTIDLRELLIYEYDEGDDPVHQPIVTLGGQTQPTTASHTATIKAHAVLEGRIQLLKTSADPSMTEGNGCYSLEGAVYSIFPSRAAATNGTDAITSLTTDASGTSNTVNLAQGTYYLKEVIAPPGYALDETIREITVTPGQTATINVSDIPGTDPIPILLQKIDSATGTARPAGSINLAGAQYRIEFYNGLYSTAAEAEASGSPLRSWIVQTNANGFADLRISSCFVSGDAFWYDGAGNVTFPFGSIVIYEIQAPAGYQLNDTHYIVTITDDGASATSVSTYNTPSLPETPQYGTVTVTKTDAQTAAAQGDATLVGAQFGLINENSQSVTINGVEAAPGEVALVITTDDSGFGTSGQIVPFGAYSLKELTPPSGYTLNRGWTSGIFTISAEGQIVNAGTCENTPVRGGISVQKIDGNSGTQIPYGNASFAGATFNIYNSSSAPVVVNGTTYAVGALITEITTNTNGYAATEDNYLPYGTYTILEASVNTGYGYTVNSNYSSIVTIDASGIVAAENCPNYPGVYGAISVQKIDAVTGTNQPSGNATLEGAVFVITNNSGAAVVVNGVSYGVGEVVETMATDANGLATSNMDLPMGMYVVTEQSPSAGYARNSSWRQTVHVTENGVTYNLNGNNSCPEPLIYGGITVAKVDAESGTAQAQGDATLGGAVFEIRNNSTKPVTVNGTSYAVGEIVATIITNNNGIASTDMILPVGTYVVTEKTASNGYLVNETWSQTVHIREASMYTLDGINACAEPVMYGQISVQKTDRATNTAVPQGDATLAGAEFEIKNASSHPIVIDGTVYAVGDVVETITTDEDGLATSRHNLSYGTYTITEKAPSAGYGINSTWSVTTEVRGDNVTIDGAKACAEPLIYGGIAVQKLDGETMTAVPRAGASLAGAQIEIRNASAHDVFVAGVPYAPGDSVMTITTDVNGYAATDAGSLPYGTYELVEVAAPRGYGVNLNWRKTVEIRENRIYRLDGDDALIDDICRADLQLVKVDGITMARMQNIPFRVTSQTTGESHLLVTDINGVIDTAALDNTYHTNGNDAAVDMNGIVDESQLNSSYGVWFSGNSQSLTASPTNEKSAFPFDTYLVEELPTSANARYELIAPFEFTISEEGQTIHLGTIDNLPLPYVVTHLLDIDSNEHISAVSPSTTLVDQVNYYSLRADKEYVIEGVLVDRETGAPILSHGSEVRSIVGPFRTTEANGAKELRYVFDSSDLGGRSVVSVATLIEDGMEVYCDLDLENPEETVHFPAISTHAHDQNNEQTLGTSTSTVIIDSVHYSNLIPGLTYTIVSSLVDKDTGAAPVGYDGVTVSLTQEYVFQATAEEGTIDVEFTFDSTKLVGMSLVATETLYRSTLILVQHNDMNDSEQTVTFPRPDPSIATVLTDQEGNKTVLAQGVQVVIDTVTYQNLIPGPQSDYRLVATLMDKDSNMPVVTGDGTPITQARDFNVTEPNGSIDVAIALGNCEYLTGHTLVAFEELYYQGTLVAEHKDINDEDQTVYFPQLATVLINANGEHIAPSVLDENRDIILTDTVTFENLLADESYRIRGILVDKDTGMPYPSIDNPIEASADIPGNTSEGTIQITFRLVNSGIDMDDLMGRSLVAFETLYCVDGTAERKVGEHADLEDEDQTVHFPKITTDARAANGTHTAALMLDATETTIIDVVSYANLIPGLTYTVNGVLMNASTGSVVLDGNNVNEVTASKTFVPTEANGEVEVTFIFDPGNVFGEQAVVFEDLLLSGEIIAQHHDIEDDAQMVLFPVVESGFKYDASSMVGLPGAKFLITDKGYSFSAEATTLLPVQEAVSNSDGYFFFAALPGHQYSIIETEAPAGYQLAETEFIVDIDEEGHLSDELTIPNVYGGTVIITKTDAITGRPLEDCVINVYKVTNPTTGTRELVFAQKTDSKGRIYFYTEDKGVYIYKEVTTINGYYLNTEEYTFTIGDDRTIEGDTRITNVPYGTVVIRKLSPEKEPLEGAQFAFFTAAGAYLGQGITDSRGRVYFVAPGPGSYYYTEVKAPKGYVLNTDKHTFRINTDYTVDGALTMTDVRDYSYGKTGDTQNLYLWLGLGLASLMGAGCFAVALLRKKRKANTQ